MTHEFQDRCAEVRERLDSFLADELSIEGNHELLRHLEVCPRCAAELESRRDLRTRLRQALDVELDAAALEARILAAMAGESAAPRRRPAAPFLALAACLAAAVAAAFLWRLAVQAPPTPGGVRVASLDAAAYRDTAMNHLNCGIRRPVPRPPTLDEAAEGLGRYARLLDDLGEWQRLGYRLVDAHICPNGDRRFGHVVLRRGEETVSLFVAEKTAGDLPDDGAIETVPGVGDTRVVTVDGFELRAVESAERFGIVASDAASDDERRAGRLLLPAVAAVTADLGVPSIHTTDPRGSGS